MEQSYSKKKLRRQRIETVQTDFVYATKETSVFDTKNIGINAFPLL